MGEQPETYSDEQDELRRAYAEEYPRLPEGSDALDAQAWTGSITGGVMTQDESRSLRNTSDLSFVVWFFNGRPQLTVTNAATRTTTTIGGREGERIFARLSPQTRVRLIRKAEGGKQIYRQREVTNMREEVRELLQRWEADAMN